MPLNIIRNDITRVTADAIVNTANPQVAVGAGVDEAIYRAAGAEQLLAERAKIGPLKPGEAAATPAFALDAKHIIHTVGPVWRGGDYGEREAVASCYRQSLKLADELHCESIAFPLISTGTYGFPKAEALKIAISEISAFLFEHDMTVYMVVYGREAFVISSKAFDGVKSYIEEHEVKETERRIAESRRRRFTDTMELPNMNVESAAREEMFEPQQHVSYSTDFDIPAADEMAVLDDEELYESAEAFGALDDEELYESAEAFGALDDEQATSFMSAPSVSMDTSLEELLRERRESFQQMLFRHIDRKGLTDAQVYKKANLDRKLFSKIRVSESYLPKKKTVLALAVALELNMDETIDLLRRAGLALNPNDRFDLIVGYCITHKIYDIYDINTYLFDYDEPLLGG